MHNEAYLTNNNGQFSLFEIFKEKREMMKQERVSNFAAEHDLTKS
jgi:3,4-dihydroxy-2-butanone 4-phosphate synthase